MIVSRLFAKLYGRVMHYSGWDTGQMSTVVLAVSYIVVVLGVFAPRLMNTGDWIIAWWAALLMAVMTARSYYLRQNRSRSWYESEHRIGVFVILVSVLFAAWQAWNQDVGLVTFYTGFVLHVSEGFVPFEPDVPAKATQTLPQGT